jgi:hypothetical protein
MQVQGRRGSNIDGVTQCQLLAILIEGRSHEASISQLERKLLLIMPKEPLINSLRVIPAHAGIQ